MSKNDWELIVVDNNSTAAVGERFDVSWHPNGKHVLEEELGLTAARLRGIAEARGSVLVFVDDDNVLAPDFLCCAARIGSDYPFLGAWGGTIDPDFEEQPPAWTAAYWSGLAIRRVENAIWTNAPDYSPAQPCGAGMCIRAEVGRAYASALRSSLVRRQLDRKGKSLISLGDTDIVLTAADLKLGWGIFPQLKLTHLIPAERLTEDYVARLIEAMATSYAMLLISRGQAPPALNSIWYERLRWLATLTRHGRRSARFRWAKVRGQRVGQMLAKQYAASCG
jgi:glycosyltransferase involved in cell wall biosynthesis